jgi:endosialidase-like protein
MKTISHISYAAFALFTFACFALLQTAQALSPAPDGGYAGENTAEGTGAMFHLTDTVAANAIGNTAIGFDALYSMVGPYGFGLFNTGVGDKALYSNTSGYWNTAVGYQALYSNSGYNNVAIGADALYTDTYSQFNIAVGSSAQYSSISNEANVAIGGFALYTNDYGLENTAIGDAALYSTTGSQNTAVGAEALYDSTGYANVALGAGAGAGGSGHDNVHIGSFVVGDYGESNTIRIGTPLARNGSGQSRTFVAGIRGAGITGTPVMVSTSGQLGTPPSSKRFKEEIKPMDKASEAILALKPVTFRYKKEIDSDRTPQFGLVAEQVEKVNPDLVARDKNGKPYTVRYDAVNAMLLNEFLKEHGKVQELENTVAKLAATVKEQASQLQKVSAELQMHRPALQRVANNQ